MKHPKIDLLNVIIKWKQKWLTLSTEPLTGLWARWPLEAPISLLAKSPILLLKMASSPGVMPLLEAILSDLPDLPEATLSDRDLGVYSWNLSSKDFVKDPKIFSMYSQFLWILYWKHFF